MPRYLSMANREYDETLPPDHPHNRLATMQAAKKASRQIVKLTPGEGCKQPGCEVATVNVTYADGRTITVHDDGSWDGHPAWTVE